MGGKGKPCPPGTKKPMPMGSSTKKGGGKKK